MEDASAWREGAAAYTIRSWRPESALALIAMFAKWGSGRRIIPRTRTSDVARTSEARSRPSHLSNTVRREYMRERSYYLGYALEIRKVIDDLIVLLEKNRLPHEHDLYDLKEDTRKALEQLAGVESKALRLYRG